MQICVLGSTRAARSEEDSEPGWLELGARKPRAVLTALALTPGQPVPAERVADLVWSGEPPRAAQGALHAYISGLRKVLEPERRSRAAASVLETTDHGYVLRVARADVDAHAFEDAVGTAERALAPLLSQLDGSGTEGWPARVQVTDLVDGLDAVLATWAGEPYADLPDHPDVVAQRAGLHRVRGAAEELRLLGLLALGEHAGVLSATEVTTALHPLRERLWALHALALTRAGRQAEALDALRQARSVLAEELGLDPGAELRNLEQAILRQEPALHAVLPTAAAGAPAPAPAAPRAVVAGTSVGRVVERDQLLSLLDAAGAGRLAAALLVGEPGIGKSRMVTDLADSARAQGVRVGLGGCSQDDGAPPFWPWLAVLDDLGREAPETEDDGDRPPGQVAFERRDAIAREVLAAAAEAPVLVVLDDLHWADDASLRTLAHLLDTAPADARLCLVGTRRTHPEPAGAYARAAESFARRHALRLDLGGLDRDEAAELLSTVQPDLDPVTVQTWHERSEGNPFFLVELARLGAADAGEVPGTVRDVVTRRLEQLPEPARDTLRTAAVVGRRFHPEYVEAASPGADADELADHLDAAVATGLLLEDPSDGTGRLAFSHALSRDAVYVTLPATRRARRHAQVAHALDTDPTLQRLVPETERVAELARHWLAAGAAHTERAWRAARDAATQARGLSDHVTAARMGVEAVAAHRRSGADEAERFDLLVAVARDAAYGARWDVVVDAAFEGIALSRSLGRPDLMGQAASALSAYCVWVPHEWQEYFPDVVDDLRWALHHVSDDDLETRCRLQLSLAVELYTNPEAAAERRALVDTGLAVARRLEDPALLTWALRAASQASWAPRWTETRLAWAEETVEAARAAGDRAAEAVALVTAAGDRLELDGPDGWREPAAAAERIAEQDRLAFVLLTISLVELNLAAMRGDAAEAERRSAMVWDLAQDSAIPGQDIQAVTGAIISRAWDGRLPEIVPAVLHAVDHMPAQWAGLHGLLARAGYLDEVRERLVTMPFSELEESWQTLSAWSYEAEAAYAVGDRALAAKCYAELTPYAGRMAVAGVAVAQGPVDGYLALAAYTLGDREAASRHAGEARRLASGWGLPAYVAWLDGHEAGWTAQA